MSKLAKDGTRLVTEWCKDIEKLYAETDEKTSPEGLWIATMAHCSVMGEGIRRYNYSELIESAAHVFCWMCSYVNLCNKTNDLLFRFENTLCEIVSLKFPRICGHCEKNECICNPEKMDEKKNKTAKYKFLLKEWKLVRAEKYTLPSWMEMFRRLYGGRLHMMTLESIGFHFLEEAGEEMFSVRQLLQLRGVANAGIEKFEESFLERITSIEGLVKEYNLCINDPNLPKKSNGKPDIDYTSEDIVYIKARIVSAKMDFVIELADTFSWFCGILIKVKNIAKCNNIDDGLFDIEKTLQNIYGKKGEKLKCSTCGETKCKCRFFFR